MFGIGTGDLVKIPIACMRGMVKDETKTGTNLAIHKKKELGNQCLRKGRDNDS